LVVRRLIARVVFFVTCTTSFPPSHSGHGVPFFFLCVLLCSVNSCVFIGATPRAPCLASWLLSLLYFCFLLSPDASSFFRSLCSPLLPHLHTCYRLSLVLVSSNLFRIPSFFVRLIFHFLLPALPSAFWFDASLFRFFIPLFVSFLSMIKLTLFFLFVGVSLLFHLSCVSLFSFFGSPPPPASRYPSQLLVFQLDCWAFIAIFCFSLKVVCGPYLLESTVSFYTSYRCCSSLFYSRCFPTDCVFPFFPKRWTYASFVCGSSPRFIFQNHPFCTFVPSALLVYWRSPVPLPPFLRALFPQIFLSGLFSFSPIHLLFSHYTVQINVCWPIACPLSPIYIFLSLPFWKKIFFFLFARGVVEVLCTVGDRVISILSFCALPFSFCAFFIHLSSFWFDFFPLLLNLISRVSPFFSL